MASSPSSHIRSSKHAASRLFTHHQRTSGGAAHAVASAATASLVALALPVAAQQQASTTLQEVQATGSAETGYKPETLSSPKFTQPLVDTPQTVSVIRREVIQEQAATTLQEALRNTPGITLLLGEGGNTNSKDNIFMRGFDSSGSVFTDGVRDLGGGARSTFNVEQIEVIKGASGSEYGRGVASGSINMSTKVPFAGVLNEARVSLGSADQKRATADMNRPINETTALRLNALVQDGGVPGRDYVRNKSTGLAPSIALGLGTATRVFGDAAIVRNDNRPDGGVPTIGLPGYYNAALDGAGLSTQSRGPVNRANYYGALDDFHKSEQDQFTVRVEHDLAQGNTLRNTTRVARNKIDQLVTAVSNVVSDNVPNPNPPPNNIAVPRNPDDWESSRSRHLRWQENKLVTNQTNLSLNLNTGGVKHSITTGVEFILEKQTSKGRSGQGTHGISPVNGAENRTNPWNPNVQDPIIGRNLQFNGQQTDGETKTVGVYVFDTMEFNPRWQLNGGVRIERFNTTTHITSAPDANGVQTLIHLKAKDTLYSGKLGLVFKPVEEGTLYVGVSTSQQPPGGSNFTLSATAANINNPNMDPSKATNVEVGTKWEVFDRRLLLTGALFQTTVRNDLSTTDAATGDIIQYGKKEVKGLELGAVGQITPAWNISAGFARMTTKVKEGTATQTGATLNWSPKKSFTSWTTYRFGNGLTLGGGGRYQDTVARQVNAANQANPGVVNMLYVPSYWVWDAYAGYQVNKNVSVQLNLYNLGDKHYFANLNNNGNRYTPGAKRSALLTATVNF